VQLAAIGVLGEYLGRIFNESKQRPLYFVNTYLPAGSAQAARARSAREQENDSTPPELSVARNTHRR